MKNVLDNIEPVSVMKYFEAISAIPRGSGKTGKVTQFLIDFAKKHSLEYYTDAVGNVVIYKNGSLGRENEEPVIVQGHIDMVWEKEPGSDFDFETQGIDLLVDGDYITANGTTLGGDDGIAAAMELALLSADDIDAPPIEAVFTVDEETGMTGASNIDASVLRGRKMLNLDSEEEGTLLVSCAGGTRAEIRLDCKTVKNVYPVIEIKVGSLHGGHSGSEIHRGYASANKIMGEVLESLCETEKLGIVSINGGTMHNAITRECVCLAACENPQAVIEKAESLNKKLKEKYGRNDPDIKLTVKNSGNTDECFDEESTNNITELLCALPFGVTAMSRDIEGMVETSSNPGVLATNGSCITVICLVRSAVNSEKDALVEKIGKAAQKCGAQIVKANGYPAWEFVKNSPLQKTVSGAYEDLYGKKMNITAIHAGLECGLFCGKISGLDCVSFGPDIPDIHTPQEKLGISSTRRTWELLLEILKRI